MTDHAEMLVRGEEELRLSNGPLPGLCRRAIDGDGLPDDGQGGLAPGPGGVGQRDEVTLSVRVADEASDEAGDLERQWRAGDALLRASGPSVSRATKRSRRRGAPLRRREDAHSDAFHFAVYGDRLSAPCGMARWIDDGGESADAARCLVRGQLAWELCKVMDEHALQQPRHLPGGNKSPRPPHLTGESRAPVCSRQRQVGGRPARRGLAVLRRRGRQVRVWPALELTAGLAEA